MPKARDITGQRFGRLVALRLVDTPYISPAGKKTRRWLCRCDCGKEIVVLQNALTGKNGTRSCGCAGSETRRRIAASKPSRKVTRKCVICGKEFVCYPSDNKVTCSHECWSERQRQLVTARPVKWGGAAKQRASAKGMTENLKLGTAAAQLSPIAGRFETNQEAKVWILVDPTGREIRVRNLLLWAREHTELFGKPPGDHSAQQIASGFYQISMVLRGMRNSSTVTYFGWTLKVPPAIPDDSQAPD